MINSRSLDDLTPGTREKAKALIAGCLLDGIALLITSTYRDNASQAALYAQGRSTPGHRVTKAKAGHSFHNHRVAFDVVPLVNGKAVWSDGSLWARIGAVGDLAGLEWGGNWDFEDKPHFQNTGGVTIAQFIERAKNVT